MIKTLRILGTERKLLSMIKGLCEKPTYTGEKLKAFLLRTGQDKDTYFHHYESILSWKFQPEQLGRKKK